MKNLMAISAAIALTLSVTATSAHAGSAPKLGGGAELEVTVYQGGVVNAGGAVAGTSVAKQALGSFLSGKITGELAAFVEVGQAGIVNAGGAVSGTSISAQAVGSVVNAQITGAVTTDAVIYQGGIVNAGGALSGKSIACQSIGSIGSDCSATTDGNDSN